MFSLAGILPINNQVLGINRRNQLYIRPHNSSAAKRISDNKILTKKVLSKEGIPTPETYKIIYNKSQLEFLDWDSLPRSFVIKPNQGTHGSGIIVIYGKRKGRREWIRPNGQIVSEKDLTLHMENILQGRFSMGNNRDSVLIEERIKTDSLLKRYCYKGVPDIRVICFNSVPVMAMLRIPTKASDGKANLHAGGIGAGIDLASGVTTTSVKRKIPSFVDYDFEQIDETYDLETNLPLRGIKIPFWDEILTMSVKAQFASGLGYTGIDVVIDREKGPMILELNARPGLGIQMVNMAGLRGRLERVDGIKIRSVKHAIRVAKSLFGGEVEEGIEAISGKQVVNLVERITIFHTNPKKLSKKETVNGMLDTGVLTSRLDTALASRLGHLDAIKAFEEENIPKSFESVKEAQDFISQNKDKIEGKNRIVRITRIVEGGKIRVRPVLTVKIAIAGVQKEIECILSDQKEMLYPILLGRRELKNYLIDPSRTFVK